MHEQRVGLPARYTDHVRYYTVSDGIVIRRTPLPSGDVVVTLLNESGKWRAVARKGNLPGGNLGRLSLFHDVSVQYYRKDTEDLALLTQVQLNGALHNLSQPGVYPYAHMITELVDALTVDVHLGERLYEYLASALRGLNSFPDPQHVALLYGWRLMGVAGLAPRVSTCAVCGSSKPFVAFDVARGGLTCCDCRQGTALSPAVAAELHQLVEGPMRRALERLENRTLHLRLLERYVSYHVSELRSFSAIFALQAAATATATANPIPIPAGEHV